MLIPRVLLFELVIVAGGNDATCMGSFYLSFGRFRTQS